MYTDVLHSPTFFSAHCTYVDILKGYHCSSLSKFMGYTLIFIISLLKCVDALVLLSAIYNILETAKQKIDIHIITYFNFHDVSLKSGKMIFFIFLLKT